MDDENVYIYVYIYIYIYIHHGALFDHKKSEMMLFAGKSMEPEIIRLSKISHVSHIFCHVWNLEPTHTP
jgi:hypothetical protein